MKWLSLAMIAVGIVIAIAFSSGLEATNTTEFCSSCHSMQWVTEEWQNSAHFSNASGVRAGCSDCHVPHDLGPKLVAKVIAAKDVWHELLGTIDTKEKFEEHRWKMANRVWDKMKATDSRECRDCHSWQAMTLDLQDRSAQRKHAQAQEDGVTCIECHTGVAHYEPYEPVANLKTSKAHRQQR